MTLRGVKPPPSLVPSDFCVHKPHMVPRFTWREPSEKIYETQVRSLKTVGRADTNHHWAEPVVWSAGTFQAMERQELAAFVSMKLSPTPHSLLSWFHFSSPVGASNKRGRSTEALCVQICVCRRCPWCDPLESVQRAAARAVLPQTRSCSPE